MSAVARAPVAAASKPEQRLNNGHILTHLAQNNLLALSIIYLAVLKLFYSMNIEHIC